MSTMLLLALVGVVAYAIYKCIGKSSAKTEPNLGTPPVEPYRPSKATYDAQIIRPITTQTAAVQAYRKILEHNRFCNGSKSMLSTASQDFKRELSIHINELNMSITAFDDEIDNLKRSLHDFEVEEQAHPSFARDAARLERISQTYAQLKTERATLRADMYSLVLSQAEHTLNRGPSPLRLQREEHPYG